MASRFKPFSSKDAVVCRNVSKTWAEGTVRAHVALRPAVVDNEHMARRLAAGGHDIVVHCRASRDRAAPGSLGARQRPAPAAHWR